MLPAEWLGAVDLFDDPAWDSPTGMEGAATCERFSHVLSPRTESVVGTVGVGLFVVYLVSLAMFAGALGYFFTHLLSFGHLFFS